MIFPKIKKCPCCNKISFIKTNGIAYENTFESLQNCIIKKIFDCIQCGQNIALFVNTETGSEKLLWTEYLRAMDVFYLELNQLKNKKNKILENYETSHPMAKGILKRIEILEETISEKQSKLRIKLRLIGGQTNEVCDDLINTHSFF